MEVDRLLNLAKIRRQPPPSFRRLADAAHEALGDIDDDAVHARVDRWLDGRFPGGVVEVKLEQRASDVAVTGPDVVDHGQIAAVVAARLVAGVDEPRGTVRGTGAERGLDHSPDTASEASRGGGTSTC